jgi:hypothetical protein
MYVKKMNFPYNQDHFLLIANLTGISLFSMTVVNGVGNFLVE